ncbi:MAG: hypothetical protein IJ573_02245 [Clostridia bacterium]|nr:hypothetical protein [Clostridia bacterium]
MTAKLKRAGLPALLAALASLVLVLFFGVRYWDTAEQPQIYDAAVLEEGPQRAPAGTQTLQLTGGSLYRVNTLRINGKRVPLRYVETVSYGECLVCVDAGTFNPGGTYRISVGKRCTLPPLELFRSNTVTFTVK